MCATKSPARMDLRCGVRRSSTAVRVISPIDRDGPAGACRDRSLGLGRASNLVLMYPEPTGRCCGVPSSRGGQPSGLAVDTAGDLFEEPPRESRRRSTTGRGRASRAPLTLGGPGGGYGAWSLSTPPGMYATGVRRAGHPLRLRDHQVSRQRWRRSRGPVTYAGGEETTGRLAVGVDSDATRRRGYGGAGSTAAHGHTFVRRSHGSSAIGVVGPTSPSDRQRPGGLGKHDLRRRDSRRHRFHRVGAR